MKRFFLSLTLVVAAIFGAINSQAGVPITLVDKITPTDMVFMDMATEAAKSSVAKKGVPQGVVFILNNAFKSSGKGKAAVEDAYKKSGLTSLKGTVVYTVNQPSTEDYNFLSQLGVETIYFVNGKDKVVAAGILPESAFNDIALPGNVKGAQLKAIEYPDAQALVK